MSLPGVKLVARSQRPVGDFYETPAWATEALLEMERFEGEILEPACGAGAISRVLEAYGYRVESSDIQDEPYIYGARGVDFLTEEYLVPCNNLITNPPYSLAQQFAEKALKVIRCKIALLLRINFLEGKKRYEFFKRTPLKSVNMFSSRVTMFPYGTEKPKNCGTAA
jgi:hypothetical protein